MDVILERCAALDIAKKTVAVCLYVRGQQQSRTFSTMTEDLLELADWLAAPRHARRDGVHQCLLEANLQPA